MGSVTMNTISSREFNQDTGRAKKAAASGPVFITDRGKLAHVLLTIEEYRRLAGKEVSLLDAVSDVDDAADFDWRPDRIDFGLKTADFG